MNSKLAGFHWTVIMALVVMLAASYEVYAQTRVDNDTVQQNLIKPERVDETCPMPSYPEGVDPESGQRGAVILFVTIDSSGYVSQARVKAEKPEGMGFGDVVVKTVSEWLYKPCYWQGKPTKYNVVETFYFENGEVRLKDREESKQQSDSEATEAETSEE